MAAAGNTTPRGSISNIANRGRSTSNHQLMMMNGRQAPQQQQQLNGGVKNMGGRTMPPPPPPPPLFGRSKSPGSLIPVGANGYHSGGHKHSGNLVRKYFNILSGNTEHGKCPLMNEYPFFLFLIGCWYYEKNILYL